MIHRSDKPVLLLLHGALGSAKQFDNLVPLMTEKFNVHRLTFDGHGGRPLKGAFTINGFVEEVKTYLEVNDLKAVHIFGYSMGGYVAIKMAIEDPSRINKIATLGTKFDWSVESAEKEIASLNPEKIVEKVPQFADKLSREHGPGEWRNVVRNTADLMESLAHGEALSGADLQKVVVPTWLGWGDMDKMVQLEETDFAAQKILNGKRVILQGVPHPLDKTDPMRIRDYIHEAFL